MEFQFGEVYIVISMSLKDKRIKFKAIMPNEKCGMLATCLTVEMLSKGNWEAQCTHLEYRQGDKISEREALNL